MNVFADYARYYDLLYKDKNYAEESAFVMERLAAHGCRPKSVLELGCGSGGHAFPLAELGHTVYGIDLSATMVEMAHHRASKAAPEIKSRLDFQVGDVRTYRAGRKFDAAVSLFHVLSYQTSNDDVRAMLCTAREHLTPGGLFLADFWYGPGVLSDRPTRREKKLEGNGLRVSRLCEPILHCNRNVVDVHYEISATESSTGQMSQARERHPMRYFFLPELLLLAESSGMEVIEYGEWLTGKEPTFASWNAYVVLRVK
jgi:SAM-dependent methyltransferase